MRKYTFILFIWAFVESLFSTNVFAMEKHKNFSNSNISNQNEQRQNKLSTNVRLIYSTKRKSNEPVSYFLYTGGKRKKSELQSIVNTLRASGKSFYLYDNLDILELEWLMWGGAFESKEYYNLIDNVSKKCKCSINKHFISADYLITDDGFPISYVENKKCPPCNISREINQLKILSQQSS